MFSSKNIYYVVFVIFLLLVSSYASKYWKSLFAPKDEYDMIKRYLLTESPLYGYDKPKIWIHSKFEYNSRKWESFHSRSSYDLNQPYIHLTIRSIIEHCGDYFHVCLIDDDTFSKLIPSWDLDLKQVAEPMKSHYREIGMAELVYYYGGMVLPNTFLCLDGLENVYNQGVDGDKMFVCEGINHTCNIVDKGTHSPFTPSNYIFGALRNNETVKTYIKYLKERNQTPHFSNHSEFLGDSSVWFITEIRNGNINLVSGDVVGIKDQTYRPILLEHLMEEEYLKLSSNCVGIYIPEDQLLRRPKYSWFVNMSSEQLLRTNMILTKYLKQSMVSYSDKASRVANDIKSVSAI